MPVECRNLSYRYPSSNVGLFDDLRLRVPERGFHALFGPSGVGKTTLAKMMAGLIGGFSGAVEAAAGVRVLYTYNMERLPGWSRVGRHFDRVAPPEKSGLVGELTRVFGIERCLESKFSRLSLGQQNRVNLTRYLLQDFDLMIMDESLANVDEATRENIVLRIKGMFFDKAFLYISHNVAEVARFCDRVLVLRDAGKSPQVAVVKGRDQTEGDTADGGGLEKTMLEIVHAS